MTSMSRHSVVDSIAKQLADRRHQARTRQARYEALARAIIFGPVEEPAFQPSEPLVTPIHRTAA
jgi:hypothetical protein